MQVEEYEIEPPKTRVQLGLMFVRKNLVTVIAGLVILSFVMIGIFAPYIAPYNPVSQNLLVRLQPPSYQHLLGTDELGRDILSRIMFGARVSLSIAVLAVGIGLAFGIPIGLVSGYAGGRTDYVVQRFVDILLAFPDFLLAIGLIAFLGVGYTNVVVAIGVASVPVYARIARSSALQVKNQLYIEAAHVLGVSNPKIMLKHVLPNSLVPLIVQSTLSLGTAITSVAGLGFLGLGVQPPTAEWGSMIGSAQEYIFTSPYTLAFPGLAIFIAVLSFNLLGDGLRDLLDPRLKQAA